MVYWGGEYPQSLCKVDKKIRDSKAKTAYGKEKKVNDEPGEENQ